jgi:hypothetical protein
MSRFHIRLQLLTALMSLLILAGCGNNQATPTGSATFNLQWDKSDTYVGRMVGAAAADICSDYGIQTITASFIDGNGISRASGSFACSAHQGIVTGIPVASNYRVRIEGLSAAGSTVAWRGEKTGVAIAANVDNPVGDVTMKYVGTMAILKLSTKGTIAAGSIFGMQFTVALPAGVTIKADASGKPDTGVVSFSGGVASGASALATKYTSAAGSTPGNVTIAIISNTGFGTGEIVTIICEVVSGTVPVSSQFALSGVTVFDATSSEISGVSFTTGLTLQ